MSSVPPAWTDWKSHWERPGLPDLPACMSWPCRQNPKDCSVRTAASPVRPLRPWTWSIGPLLCLASRFSLPPCRPGQDWHRRRHPKSTRSGSYKRRLAGSERPLIMILAILSTREKENACRTEAALRDVDRLHSAIRRRLAAFLLLPRR